MGAMTFKRWLILITFTALGLLILLAWRDILDALGRLGTLNIWVLALILPLLFLVYFSLTKYFVHFFEVFGTRLKLRTIFASILELNFVNHVFPSGGLSGFSYLTLRLKPYGISTAKSTLAQIGRFAFALSGQVALMFVSLFLLAIEGRANSVIILLVSILVFSLITSGLGGLFVISSQRRSVSFASFLARFINKAIHIFRPKHPETINLHRVEETLVELHTDYVELRQNLGKMKSAFFWITFYSFIEVAILYVVFLAHGVWINPGAVVIAYVLATTAGLIAALPGGIGVFEAIMTTVFIAVGVPPGLALSATLVYRIITLLLNLLAGAALYHRAINKLGEDNGTTNIHR